MAKMNQNNLMRCQHCGEGFTYEQWYDEYSYADRGNVRAPRQRIVPNCACPYPVAKPVYIDTKPASKEAPVTEKQYSTEPLKNDALKAVSKAFKTVEETLLTNTIERKSAEDRASALLTNALDRLDKTLLEAGQSGILFDDLTTAFPTDGDVLTDRLESVWAKVSFDNLENVS
jgi:hypothetical protein